MTWFNNLSIKRKLIILIFGITLLAQIIVFSILNIERFNYLKNELIAESQINAKLIGEYCVSPLIFEDAEGLNQILQKSEALPYILSAAIYDTNGELISFYQKADEKVEIPQHEIHEDIYLKNILHIREAINHKGIKYGQIHLRVSAENMKKEISKQLLFFALIVVGTIIFIYFLANRFQKIISAPILKLAAFTDEISQTADYSLKIEKQSEDETGKLYDNFNNMIRKIKTRQEEKNEADAALKRSQEHLSETSMLANVGGWEIDFIGNTLRWTSETYRIHELPEDKMPDVTDAIRYYHPEDQQRVNDLVQRAIETSDNFDFEARLLTAKNNLKWVRSIGRVNSKNGKNIGVHGMIQDITERKLKEEELIKYRDHLEELVKERTMELEEKNKKLEKFNDLFVNREFRIKELKDKLKEFEKKK